MKIQPPKEYWKTWGPSPLISYKADGTIGKTLTVKYDSLKVNIKTQPEDRDSKMVEICVTLFQAGTPEALFDIITLFH